MTSEKVLKILITVAKYFIGMAEKEMRETYVVRSVGIEKHDISGMVQRDRNQTFVKRDDIANI